MFRKISIFVLAFSVIFSPVQAAGKAESLEEGIEQLAIDISSQMKAKGVRKIAIDDFTDLNGYKSALGDFISEELVTNFYTQGAGSFEVVERRELARVLKEQKLGESGLLNKDTIAKVGEVLGIDAIVTGSIAYLGRNIKINARMLGVNDAKVFAATSQKVAKDEMVEELLSQGGRVDGNSGTIITSSHIPQPLDSIYQNSFLLVRPISIAKTKDGKGLLVSIDIQNKLAEKIFIGAKRAKGTSSSEHPEASLIGDKGTNIKDTKISMTGLDGIYNAGEINSYTPLEGRSRIITNLRFFSNEEIDDTAFNFIMEMFLHFGKGKDWSSFTLGIPNIRLQQ